MVYKKYLKKGGKTFGPYYYESYRDNGKVKKRYLGGEREYRRLKSREENKSFGRILFIFSLFFLIFFVVSEINTNVKAMVSFPENFQGLLKFSGFSVSENSLEFSSKNISYQNYEKEIIEKQIVNEMGSVEIKSPPKIGGVAITKNKNKRIEFKLADAKINLYFDLLDYNKFSESFDQEIINSENIETPSFEESEEEMLEGFEEETGGEIEEEIEEKIEENLEINESEDDKNKTKNDKNKTKNDVNKTKDDENKTKDEINNIEKDIGDINNSDDVNEEEIEKIEGIGEIEEIEEVKGKEKVKEETELEEPEEKIQEKPKDEKEPGIIEEIISGNLVENFLSITGFAVNSFLNLDSDEEEIKLTKSLEKKENLSERFVNKSLNELNNLTEIPKNSKKSSDKTKKIFENNSDELTKEKIKEIIEKSIINPEEFDINFDSDKSEKEQYYWSYKFKLNDFDFMTKIHISSDKSISKWNETILRIGNNLLNFEDLIKQGYVVHFGELDLKSDYLEKKSSLKEPEKIIDIKEPEEFKEDIKINDTKEDIEINETIGVNKTKEKIIKEDIEENITQEQKDFRDINASEDDEDKTKNDVNKTKDDENKTKDEINNIEKDIGDINNSDDVNEEEIEKIEGIGEIEEIEEVKGKEKVKEETELEEPEEKIQEKPKDEKEPGIIEEIISGNLVENFLSITGFAVSNLLDLEPDSREAEINELGYKKEYNNEINIYIERDFREANYSLGEIISLDLTLIKLKILNPYAYLRDGDNWTVLFDTIGEGNLTIWSNNSYWNEIQKDNNSTIDEMKFINISCGENLLFDSLKILDLENNTYNYLDINENDSIKPDRFFIPNYNCDETTSRFVNYMNIAGYATLIFKFENQDGWIIDYAFDPPGTCDQACQINGCSSGVCESEGVGDSCTFGCPVTPCSSFGLCPIESPYCICYAVQNNAPVTVSSRISPASPYTNQTLKGYCNATDSDEDSITYYYRWYKDNVLNLSGSAGTYTQGVEVNVNNLSSSSTFIDNNWTFSCLANDATENASNWINESVVIQKYNTTLTIFDQEDDDEEQSQSNDLKVYANEYTTFYANFSSPTTGKDIGNAITRIGDIGSTYSVAAIDLDGDGIRSDFVVGEYGDIFAYYGNGNQAWANSNPVEHIFEMEVTDINNDGLDEAVVIDYNGYLRIYNATGSEIFSAGDYGTYFYSIDVGDLDDDGYGDDIVIGGRIGGSNYGMLAFTYDGATWNNIWNATDPTDQVYEVKISEIDGESNLAGCVSYGGRVLVYYGNNGTNILNSGDLGYGSSFDFIDLDSDGQKDEVVMAENSDLFAYYLNGTQAWVATEPYGWLAYEVMSADLDNDGYEDEAIMGDILGTVWAFDENGDVLWEFNEPQEINQHWEQSYFGEIEIGDINNDGDIDILAGGLSRTVWALNRTGSVIGRYYVGFDSSSTGGEYIGYYPAGSQAGIDIIGDTNNDGIDDFVFTRVYGYAYVAQQVLCEIRFNDSNSAEYMIYNYSSGLYEYSRAFNETDFDMGDEQNNLYSWNVTCSKAGYIDQVSSNYNLTVYNKNSSLDSFDQEDDEENKAGWLTEDSEVMADENTYFFANYSDLEQNQSLEEYGFENIWVKDIGANSWIVRWADLDQDGIRDEAVISEYSDLYAYDLSGNQLWRAEEPVYTVYDMAVGDLDDDGYYDDIVVVGDDDYIRVFNDKGDEVWNSGDIGDHTLSVEIGDLDKDGVKDDFVVSHDNGPNWAIVAYNTEDGETWTEMWEYVNSGYFDNPREVRIGDTNSSYDYNYVSAVSWGTARPFALYSNNGSIAWVDNTDKGTIYSLDFVDLDNDGNEDEVVFGESGDLLAYDENGNSLWSAPEPEGAVYEVKKADLDNDGYEDEIVIGDIYRVRAFDKDGNQLWYTNAGTSQRYYMAIQIGDIDGDGSVEILAGNQDDIMYVYNASGSLLYKYETKGEEYATSMSRMGSADGYSNNAIDISETTADNKIYVLVTTEDFNTYLLRKTPYCDIQFNDSVFSNMNYNNSADLFYYNRSFSSGGTYGWNLTCNAENFVTKGSGLKTITISQTTPQGSRFEIKDSLGNVVAAIDDSGNMFLNGTLTESPFGVSPPGNSFILKNNAGTAVAYINEVGNLFITGTLTESASMTLSGSNLEIRNATGSIVAFFDDEGNVKLSGTLTEEYSF